MLNRTIISLEQPKKINLSDTLPILGGKSKAVELKDFIAEVKSHGNKLEEWSEDISYQAEEKFNFIHQSEVNNLTPEIVKQCESNYPKMTVCYMGDTLGYGVFALEDFKKGQPIAIYAGDSEILNQEELIAKHHGNKLSYLFQIGVNEEDKQFIINPEKRGNISRFLQHAPGKESEALEQYEFKADYATANMNMIPYSINHQNLPILIANRDINKNEMLCFDYGSKYWAAHNIDPYFFNKYGQTLDKSQYKILNMHITISPKSDMNKDGSFSVTLTIPEADFEKLLEEKTPLTTIVSGDTRFTVSAAELKEARLKNPDNHHLSFEITDFELGISFYAVASCEILNKLTGNNWQYSPGNNILMAKNISGEKNEDLEKQGFKVARALLCNPSMMFAASSTVTIINLNDKNNQEKLIALFSSPENTEKMSLSK